MDSDLMLLLTATSPSSTAGVFPVGGSIDDLCLFLDPCPCDGCEEARRCARWRLACRAFSHYVATGQCVAGTPAVDQPTRDRYEQLFFDSGLPALEGSRDGTRSE